MVAEKIAEKVTDKGMERDVESAKADKGYKVERSALSTSELNSAKADKGYKAVYKNEMEIRFDAVSANESFARLAVAAFVSPMNPTVEELSDIKTAVSEAVTNAIIHGYENLYGYGKHGELRPSYLIIHPGKVRIHCVLEQDMLHIEIEDRGNGIDNIDRAMEPLYTTKPDLERSGMGFAFMEAFMDDLEVESEVGKGTLVRMSKKLGTGAWIWDEEA